MGSVVTSIIVAALLIPPAQAQRVDLSPARWPVALRARLEAREAAMRPATSRKAESGTGMVSATMSPVAAHAGAEVLRQGGSAADAAITTALTQVTMMTGANVSFAGAVQLLYFDARTRRVYVLDGGWNGWSGETQPATIPGADINLLTGSQAVAGGLAGRKTLVPGYMAGLEALHGRFGRLRWSALFDPAIWYADHGVPVTPLLSAYFGMARTSLSRTAEGKAFLMPDGVTSPRIGDRFAPPGLADSLRAVARHGAGEMYTGGWARRYVAAIRAAGGAATMADLAAYRPEWREPVSTGFADGQVFGPDAANPSGCAMAMALNLLNHSGSGRRYWQDADTLRTLGLTLRVASAAPYLPQVAALGREIGASGCQARAGDAFGAAAAPRLDALAGIAPPQPAGRHTATVVAVDRWGNVAALVHSSNTMLWGDSGLIVGGVPIPMAAGIYQQRLATIAPGGRLPSDMAPLMLLRGGRPVVALAGAGTSVVPESVRLMIGLSGGDSMTDWLSAPPLLLNFEQAALPLGEQDELIPAGAYSGDLMTALGAMGFRFREVDGLRTATLRGTVAAVRIRRGGIREAAEVPEVPSFAERQ